MGSHILNLLLLVLRIPLYFFPNASYKGNKFFDALSEKNLEFVPSRRDGTIAFNLDIVLLQAEVDSIPEKKGCKIDALGTCGITSVKIIFALLTKVAVLYVGVIMV